MLRDLWGQPQLYTYRRRGRPFKTLRRLVLSNARRRLAEKLIWTSVSLLS